MGTYWKPVNLDKCEAAHPHHVNDGLKWREWVDGLKWREWVNDNDDWTDPGETFGDGHISATRRWVHKLIAFGHWSADDEIRIVSDAGGSVAWLGRRTDRAADYDGPEFPDADGRIDAWRDAPHPDTLKAPAPTLVPADEEPLVEHRQEEAARFWHPSETACTTDDEPPASVEELLASHPGPWRIESVTPGAETIRVVDPLGQVVAVLPGPYYAAAQLLVIARETPFYTPTSGLGGGE